MTTRPAELHEALTPSVRVEDAAALATLYRIVEVVNADLDPRRILQAVTDEATALLGAAFGAYFSNVEDESGASYQLSTLTGADRQAFSRFPRPRATRVFAPTFRGDGIVRLADVTADPRYGQSTPYHGMPPGHPPVRSYLAVPVVASSGEVLGGLFFGHSEVGVFDEQDEQHAQVVARHTALAVEKARLFAAEQQARLEAEATTVRLALLQTLTAELAAARETSQVSAALVASSEVGLGAARAVIYLADGDELVAVRPHSFRDGVVDAYGRLGREADLPPTDVFRTASPVFCGSVEERDARWPALAAEDPGDQSAWAVLPLATSAERLGVVVFGWTSDRDFTADEQRFLGAIAHQCAQAVERARLYESLRDMATTLQQSLLPPRVQAPDGLEVATRYRPVEAGAQVGGDFYDVFLVAPGRYGVVIGDVSGKGVRAASLTSLARHTVRVAARSEPCPALVLGVLNDELLEAEQDHFCTVAYLEVEPSPEACRVRLALAGHPQPLLRRADGTTQLIGRPGMAAGLLPMAEVENSDTVLQPGDTLVLVTDGVVEARDASGSFADDLLVRAVEKAAHADAEAVADAVVDAAVSFAGGTPRDDIAVVVLRVPEPGAAGAVPDVAVLALPPLPESVARARAEVAAYLAHHGRDDLTEVALLLTSELVTNAVRHAGTLLTMRVGLRGPRLRVEVTDGSRLRPVRQPYAPDVESGRGLHLLERMSPEWGVRRTPEGKSVWFELVAEPDS